MELGSWGIIEKYSRTSQFDDEIAIESIQLGEIYNPSSRKIMDTPRKCEL